MPLYQPPNVNTPVLTQFPLTSKIACVTGGAGGIGTEIVRGLAEAGADVAIIYHTSSHAHELAANIAAETGQRVKAFQSDVTKREVIACTIEEIARDFGGGRLDVCIANSGVCANIPALEYTEEQWRYNNGVNFDGAMWTAQAAGKIFKKQGRGNLVITGSVSASLVNVPQTQVAYNASKAAAVHLTKSLAVEWADFARVNSVSPGFILTDMILTQPKELMDKWLAMIPGRRICHPAELKSIFVFLSGDSCSYMTGSNIVVDGGYTLP